MDELSREQLMAIPHVSAEAFLYIMRACEQGVESTDSLIRAHACTSILNICSFVIKETEKAERETGSNTVDSTTRRRSSVVSPIPGNHWLMTYFRQFPQTLPSLLSNVFNLVLFEDNSDQWSLSRPLYALMLLQREYTVKYINAVIEQQLPERRTFVATVSELFFLFDM